MQYKLLAGTSDVYRVNENGSYTIIPPTEENYDWQRYQAWLAADPKNKPLPADEEQ